VLCIAALFTACEGLDPAIGDQFVFSGLTRSYEFVVPDSYTGEVAVPLVIVLHGKDQTTGDIRFNTHFDDVATREGFIVAYPLAYKGAWNDGRIAPSQPSFIENVDDVGFIAEVVARLVANYNIDTARLYVCGFSNGALMTHRLAFQTAEVFAAFGCVTSAIPVTLPGILMPERPVNICMMHGTQDRLIPWEGGEPFPNDPQGELLSVLNSVGYWITHNGCGAEPAVRELPNRETIDRTQIVEYTYGPCESGTEVVFYWIENGGHAWPGTPSSQALFTQGNISRDIDGAETLWNFFRDKTKPVK
jgi:polyhydroxybutyrate depolymerase